MSIFNVNFSRLIRWGVPTRLRKPKHLAWLRTLMSPLIRVYGFFRINRDRNLYRLRHGHSVAHLRALINDRYDPAMRRITVTDAPLDYQPTMVYKTIENQPVYLYQPAENSPKFLWTDEEVNFGGIDFVVNVPVSLVYDQQEMRAFINENKMPGLGYVIQDV